VSSLPQDIADLGQRVRNWGRWGDDDQLGTLNLIDDAAVRRGLAAAVTGRRLSLAIPLSADGPQMGFIPGRENPPIRTRPHPSQKTLRDRLTPEQLARRAAIATPSFQGINCRMQPRAEAFASAEPP